VANLKSVKGQLGFRKIGSTWTERRLEISVYYKFPGAQIGTNKFLCQHRVISGWRGQNSTTLIVMGEKGHKLESKLGRRELQDIFGLRETISIISMSTEEKDIYQLRFWPNPVLRAIFG
jgi:hypothetical protein